MFTIVFLSVWKPLPIVVLGEGLTFKLIFFCRFTWLVVPFFVVTKLWVAGFSQVRKCLGKSSSRLGIGILFCQGIDIVEGKSDNIKTLPESQRLFPQRRSKFVENVSVINGWRLWLLGEAGGCYYIRHFNLWIFSQSGISQRIFKPDNCGKYDLWKTLSWPVER